jgi:hypothetical protein
LCSATIPQSVRFDRFNAGRMQVVPAQHRDAAVRRNVEVEIEARA